MPLPSGFIPLRDVIDAGPDSCFLGVITTIKTADPNRPNAELYFSIRDRFPGEEKDNVPCVLQRKPGLHLPEGSPGDIAILRGMKLEIRGRNNVKTLVSCREFYSSAQFFPVKSIPAPEFAQGYHTGGSAKLPFNGTSGSKPPTFPEQVAVIEMKAAAAAFLEELNNPKVMFRARLGPNSSISKKDQKEALIKDMVFDKFYDHVGEVVKTFWFGSEAIDLYVTDYTENKDLFDYKEETDYGYPGGPKKPWPGPLGQKTLQVRLYGPHAEAAKKIKEGDFVFLQNIRIKMSQMGRMEGNVHQDPRFPEKIGVRICTNRAQFGPILQRKAEYEQSSAKALLDHSEPTNDSTGTSANRKLSKREKKQMRREREEKALEEKIQEAHTPVKGMNKNIKTGDKDVVLSTVDDIVKNSYLKTPTEDQRELTLPFVNSRYHTLLRVVDHYPLKLKSFTRPVGSLSTTQVTTASESTGDSQSGRYEWHFFLLVEDADAPAGTTPTRFPLTIDTPRAQCLLDMDPVDLSARPDKLSKLEQKLFLLWGNLHERKIALKKEGVNLPLPVGDKRLALSNKPFECCVEEYGIAVDSKGMPYTDADLDSMAPDILGDPKTWKRTWSLYNTRIKD